jgi:hypothetical protein
MRRLHASLCATHAHRFAAEHALLRAEPSPPSLPRVGPREPYVMRTLQIVRAL